MLGLSITKPQNQARALGLKDDGGPEAADAREEGPQLQIITTLRADLDETEHPRAKTPTHRAGVPVRLLDRLGLSIRAQ